MFGIVQPKDGDPIPGGSLLTGWPEGFDARGRNVLDDVGEFQLVELYYPGGPRIVEYSPPIKAALDRYLFSVSEASTCSTPEERIELARAFWILHEDNRSLAESDVAARILNAALKKAMKAGDVEVELNTLAGTLRAAMRSVAALENKLSSSPMKVKVEAAAILEGGRIFQKRAKRPRQREIIRACERNGYIYRGKNKRSSWTLVFERTALDDLDW
jgi:hypothetical protein